MTEPTVNASGDLSFPILYKKNKSGGYQQWSLRTEGGTIHTEYGQVDGALQHTSKEAKPKNVGRDNETTAVEQAHSEARSMYKKKFDANYALSMEAADEVPILPMLAKPIEKVRKRINWDAPGHFIQPKLDGVRCIARWVDGKVRLFSRKNIEWVNLGHIVATLEEIMPQNMVFDGEIYRHGLTFQEVSKLVKKSQTIVTQNLGKMDTRGLQFHVYDGWVVGEEDTPYRRRRWQIWSNIPREYNDRPHIIPVRTLNLRSDEDIDKAFVGFVKSGYEGAIVRIADGPYTIGHRSGHLLKVKAFEDEEYRISGFYEGKGRYKGAVTWICDLPDGRTFHCVPKGTMEQKRDWFEHGEEYIGQMLKVKFFEKTDDGVPRFPVGIGIRLPEDMGGA